MPSVVKRINIIKQPYGGYIRPREFECKQLQDDFILSIEENIHSGLIGLAVDYLTRFKLNQDAKEAFQVSLLGAKIIHKEDTANELMQGIKGLDNNSIINACKLSGFDVCYRASTKNYKPVEEIIPDSKTIDNIRIMVNRCLTFTGLYGPIVKSNFTFEGGYTKFIDSGDGDYLTKDTLWDLKVSKYEPKSKHTLQLLVYYLMGLHSIHSEYDRITNLGIFNPRLNKVYIISIDKIPIEVMDDVERNVIGYGLINTKQCKVKTFDKHTLKEEYYETNANTQNEVELTVADISKHTNLSKNVIYKWIRSGSLNAIKRKNKYYIKLSDFESFMKRKRWSEYIRIGVLFTTIFIIVLLWLLMFT